MAKIPYNIFLKGKLNATVIKEPGTILNFSEPRNIMTSLGNDIKEEQDWPLSKL